MIVLQRLAQLRAAEEMLRHEVGELEAARMNLASCRVNLEGLCEPGFLRLLRFAHAEGLIEELVRTVADAADRAGQMAG